jgi:hypothetical protein
VCDRVIEKAQTHDGRDPTRVNPFKLVELSPGDVVAWSQLIMDGIKVLRSRSAVK